MTTIHLGISTCPNDTFAFHGLMTRQVDWRGLTFDVELIDIQQLNLRLFQGDFDAAKASFHAALLLADETVVLPSGSALGFGVEGGFWPGVDGWLAGHSDDRTRGLSEKPTDTERQA